MKRQLLYFFLLSAIAISGFAQSLELSNLNGIIPPNSIIIQAGTPDSGTLVTHLNVKNISNTGINVLCKKSLLSLLDSTMMLFCWGICYDSSVHVSPNPQYIEAGHSFTEFVGDYIAMTASYYFHSGESVVRWVFFNQENVNDSVSVTVKYTTYPLGIAEVNNRQPDLSNAFPNPAGASASFNYSIPTGSTGVVIVRNVLGSTVLSEQLAGESGKFTINSFNLSEGIYFYSLMVDGKISQTKKLIVKH